MNNVHRRRRVVALAVVMLVPLVFLGKYFSQDLASPPGPESVLAPLVDNGRALAVEALADLSVKDRAPKTGYSRAQFGNGWANWSKCDTRQKILVRDLKEVILDEDDCTVLSGVLNDPYTGQEINFQRGANTSSAVQIDHVVALSDAWQKGAATWPEVKRQKLANDDLELLAVDGKTNQQKSDGDAATWLPPNKAFRCQYVARQIAVKLKYQLWLTAVEHDAMAKTLSACPDQRLPAP